MFGDNCNEFNYVILQKESLQKDALWQNQRKAIMVWIYKNNFYPESRTITDPIP